MSRHDRDLTEPRTKKLTAKERRAEIDRRNRRLLVLSVAGVAVIVSVPIGIGLAGLSAAPTPAMPANETHPAIVARLRTEVRQDPQRFYGRAVDVVNLGVDMFVTGMAEEYGLAYDAATLQQQARILRESEFRTGFASANGCTTASESFKKNTDAGLTNPGMENFYINVDAIARAARGTLNAVDAAIAVTAHELGHFLPEDTTSISDADKFQALLHPGWTLKGSKGFALVVQVPEFDKPGTMCLGRPGYDLTWIEECQAESDKILIAAKNGIVAGTPENYKLPVEKFQTLIMSRLSSEDRRKVGIMHKQQRGLERFLTFYKQNFNIQGNLADAYLQLNQYLK